MHPFGHIALKVCIYSAVAAEPPVKPAFIFFIFGVYLSISFSLSLSLSFWLFKTTCGACTANMGSGIYANAMQRMAPHNNSKQPDQPRGTLFKLRFIFTMLFSVSVMAHFFPLLLLTIIGLHTLMWPRLPSAVGIRARAMKIILVASRG